MHRLLTRLASTTQKVHAAGIHTTASRAAITRFNMPAMSPTMTEGTIHSWKLKEGDSFAAGDLLLELETDKAQIDVEAPEDGVLAKILLKEGEKAPVNSMIALLAEEGDDISNVEIPKDDGAAPAAAEQSQESAAPAEPEVQPSKAAAAPTTPMDHHDLDTSKLKKPLSPAVLSLVLKHHIKDLDKIKASGPGGRILKGDVLAHLGMIAPKPMPKFNNSAAPPRDQIVFAKPAEAKIVKDEAPLPTFISKRVALDSLLQLRGALNAAQHGTSVSVNDFIAKAAARALQDVTKPASSSMVSGSTGIVHHTQVSSFASSYKGGQFKVFHLAEPSYDFITDSYSASKPYTLNVTATKRVDGGAKKSQGDDMLDLISYLGNEKPKAAPRAVGLTSEDVRLDFAKQPQNQVIHQVEMKLEGGAPGKILNDAKAAVFFDRLEHYVKNPSELVV
ncbi:uncharacterized protein BYT42DRAFT_158332 [Radiomyces spectabilis]|uniref:uncharacterized protein n=1 Tax=Radiomyces spectabilis TaxID=64574 RepID=UPI002220872F|nr:uncharacterized protein BYT42DRAFT_158332 [Radiomyces spectabilis]KAI8365262.1 hypothetical protein BYT42DRAFT_158332 [Radiomyces spectabilis]